MAKVKTEPRSGEKAYKHIHSTIEATLKWRARRTIGDRMWARAERLNKGCHWSQEGNVDPTSDDPNDLITVNLTSSAIQDFLPFLVRQAPEWLLKAKGKVGMDPAAVNDLRKDALIASALMNETWEEGKMQRALRKVVLSGLVFGHGIIKTGWTLELDKSANEKKDGKLNYNTAIKEEAPFARWVDPFKFLFDPEAEDRSLDTARWCAELLYVPLQDVVANDRYNPKVVRKIRDGEKSPTTVKSFRRQQLEYAAQDEESIGFAVSNLDDDVDTDMVVLVEYWDKKFDRYLLFALGVDEPLLEKKRPFSDYMTELPYVMWNFQELPNEPYGLGVPEIIVDQQLELDRIRTTEFMIRRKHGVPKLGILKGSLDLEEKLKLVSDDAEVVEFDNLADAKELRTGTIPPDNYRVDAVIQEDIRRMLGLDQLLTGGKLPSRTSAREVDARRDLIGLKAGERIARVDELVMELGKQLWKHIQANMRKDRVVMIAGPDAAESWELADAEAIRSKAYDLRVLSTSREKHDPTLDKQQRMQVWESMMNAIVPLAQQGWQVEMPRVTKFMLEGFDYPEIETFITPIPKQPPVEGGGDGSVPPTDAGGLTQASVDQGAGPGPSSELRGDLGA